MTEDEAKKLARALVDEVMSRLAGANAPERKDERDVEPVFMKVDAYAKSRGFARSTIQEYLNAGMPCVVGRGGRRVDVRAADAWIRMGAASRELHS